MSKGNIHKAGHLYKLHLQWLIVFLLCFVLVLPTAMAIEECTDKVEPSDIPCMIVSSYHFEPDCPSNTAKVYDSTKLLSVFTFGDYLDSGLCNFTFNYTSRGTYIINASEGSVRMLEVEGYQMEFFNLSVFAFFLGLSIVFIFLMHKTRDESTGSSVAYGAFSSVIMFIMGAIITSGFNVINTGIVLFFDLNYYLAALCYILGFYTVIHSVMLYKYNRPKKDDFEVD